MPDLPSPSESACKIMHLAQDDLLSLTELEQAVRSDPAFAARLLRIVNSGRRVLGGRPIVSIKDALVALGLPTVRGLALGFSLMNGHRTGRCKTFDYNTFWLYSLALAQAFQTICLNFRPAPRDEAFSVGLLANIGQLALACVFPEPFAQILEGAAKDNSHTLAEREVEILGLDHWELSAELLKEWGIPDTYTIPVALHRQNNKDIENAGQRSYNMTCALAVAADIADVIVYPHTRTPEKITELHRHGARVSIEDDAIVEIGNQVAEEWRGWIELLGLKHNPDMNFSWVTEAYRNSRILTDAVTSEKGTLSVLVVEDDKLTLSFLTKILTQAGYHVSAAENGEKALKQVRTSMPDVIITDWLMPVMDGIEFIREVRNQAKGIQPYVVMLTTRSEDDALVEAFGAGADDFLTKPLKPMVLLARMKSGERILLLQREANRLYGEMRNVANELSASNRRLQTLATTDELTGLPNRRYALERLQQEWDASARNGGSLACLVADIDSFKQINETYGINEGDEVIRRVALIIRESMRTEDVVCRVGSEEFLIICPNTDLAMAKDLKARLLSKIATRKLTPDGKFSTISIGTAERTSKMQNPTELIEAADKSLLQGNHPR